MNKIILFLRNLIIHEQFIKHFIKSKGGHGHYVNYRQIEEQKQEVLLKHCQHPQHY